MMTLIDKTIGLKAALGLVLAFCQFCQGFGLNGKKVGTVTKSMKNVKVCVKVYMTKLYIYSYLYIFISLYSPILQAFKFCQSLFDKSMTKVNLV